MVLRPDQERVRSMLKDTITLLCKNGLSFKNKFSIEAVIGVTLDDDDVFLISMNEIVKSATAKEDSEVSYSADENSPAMAEHKNRRRKRKRSGHRNQGSVSNDSAGEDNYESDNSFRDPVPVKAIKGEVSDSDKSEDIVFIKQEMEHVEETDAPWSQPSSSHDISNYSNYSNLNASQEQNISMSAQQQDQVFSLSDLNLVPMGSSQDSGAWGSPSQFVQGSGQSSTPGQAGQSGQSPSAGMFDVLPVGDPCYCDQGTRYKWRWDWLNYEPRGQPPLSHCFRKVNLPGTAVCVCCVKRLKYQSAGLFTLKDHVTTKCHQARCAGIQK